MRISKNLAPYTGELSFEIDRLVQQVTAWFNLTEPAAILEYNGHSIAIPITFHVSLPTRKAVGGIDIRAEEPMLLVVNKQHYPSIMPSVLSDRSDFPRGMLAHLYFSRDEVEPASLCLVRNSPNEWFANKTIEDLLIVANQWLFKAAIGKLSDDNNEWDPMRLSFSGNHIYPYNLMADIVTHKRSLLPDKNFAFLVSYFYRNGHHQDEFANFRSLTELPIVALKPIVKGMNEAIEKGLITDRRAVISLLVWADENHIENQYFSLLPKNLGELRAFLKLRGVELDPILKTYIGIGCLTFGKIPFIYAARRPSKLIGYEGNFEFINQIIDATKFKSGYIPEDSIILNLNHIEPFSHDLATLLSGEERKEKTLYVGAGSLGSKMIMHDARAGKMNIGVVDNDDLLQHNIVRHALYENRIGIKKATAIVEEIKSFHESDTHRGFVAVDHRINFKMQDLEQGYDWLVDTTASYDTANFFSNYPVAQNITLARAELADKGRLGLLHIEGPNRNPRVDDLINLACYEAVNNPDLAHWRKTDMQTVKTSLSVGLGCSSTTNVMADDTISFHAAAFSRVLQQVNDRTRLDNKGLLYLSVINQDNIGSIRNHTILVEPFEIYPCEVKSGWTIRMKAGLTAKLLKLAHIYNPLETGGILIGNANQKTRTIHIFDVKEQPKDSENKKEQFVRGIAGMKEFCDNMKKQTGDMIGYVGEWHSHPMNLESTSIQDLFTAGTLQAKNHEDRIPTLSLITTLERVIPFVFEQNNPIKITIL